MNYKYAVLMHPIWIDDTRDMWSKWRNAIKKYNRVYVFLPEVSDVMKINYLKLLIKIYDNNREFYKYVESIIFNKWFINKYSDIDYYKKILTLIESDRYKNSKKVQRLISRIFRYDFSSIRNVKKEMNEFKLFMGKYNHKIIYLRAGDVNILKYFNVYVNMFKPLRQIDVFGAYGNRCVAAMKFSLKNVKVNIIPELSIVREKTYRDIWKRYPKYPRQLSGKIKIGRHQI